MTWLWYVLLTLILVGGSGVTAFALEEIRSAWVGIALIVNYMLVGSLASTFCLVAAGGGLR